MTKTTLEDKVIQISIYNVSMTTPKEFLFFLACSLGFLLQGLHYIWSIIF